MHGHHRGVRLKGDGDGHIEKDSIAAHDPGWTWAVEVAPGIEIDGLDIRSYLDWLARETGRELVFESEEIEAYARDHQIAAPSVPFSVAESLEILRMGSDLDVQEQNGKLLVFGPR